VPRRAPASDLDRRGIFFLRERGRGVSAAWTGWSAELVYTRERERGDSSLGGPIVRGLDGLFLVIIWTCYVDA
jgi:hypothetical protein